MNLIDADDLLNSADAAAYLEVSKQRLHMLRQQGRLGVLVAGIWLYSKTELDEYRLASKGKHGRRKGYNLPENKLREEKSR